MLGLRTNIYKVSDIEKAKKWYAKAFEGKPYFDESFDVGFNIIRHELGLMPEGKYVNFISCWWVEKMNEIDNRFFKLGATEHEKTTNVGGEIRVASQKNSRNNVIGFICNPDFKLLSN